MSNLFKISFKNFFFLFFFKGFIGEIILAYKGFINSYQRQIFNGISESGLLAYSFFIGLVLFLQRLPDKLSINSQYLQNNNLNNEIGIDLFVSVFFVPIFLYIISFFLHIFCLPFGSKASVFESRVAFFWSTVVSSPFLLLFAILGGFSENVMLSELFKLLSIFLYAWIFSSIFCWAHKFSTNIYLFLLLIIFYISFTYLSFV